MNTSEIFHEMGINDNQVCVFCGKLPNRDNKTREHIIPRWLIELTGKSNRTMLSEAGFHYLNLGEKQKKIIHSANTRTLPACSGCNNKFAELEGRCKEVFLKIENGLPVNGIEITTLLDWLDKVRMSEWHMKIISRERSGLDFLTDGSRPTRFFIDNRIARVDRFALFFRTKDASKKGLNWLGTLSYFFIINPSVFCIIVNGLGILNFASEGLLRRFEENPHQFPFAKFLSKNSYVLQGGSIKDFRKGSYAWQDGEAKGTYGPIVLPERGMNHDEKILIKPATISESSIGRMILELENFVMQTYLLVSEFKGREVIEKLFSINSELLKKEIVMLYPTKD